ncbi:hypothetical protein B0H14DRAFT_2602701 [Mycena olivaceomarginata]|nr:hypothetical protein B0H14DRAFT_2602701 [Mycena olivaceomarginata]
MYKMPFLRAASSTAVGGAMPPLRATSSAAERFTGRPVYVPTCHRFCLVRPLTARINWRSMSIPNAAPARRVERSSGRRYAFLARHVERSGAVNGIPVYVPTCHRFCLVRLLMPPESIEGPYV